MYDTARNLDLAGIEVPIHWRNHVARPSDSADAHTHTYTSMYKRNIVV